MRTFLNIIIIILIITGLLLIWGGALRPVVVDQIERPEITAVYLIHNGSYTNIGPVFDDVQEYLQSKGVSVDTAFGMYFNDPGETPEELLTSWIGFVVSDPIEVEEPYKRVTLPASPSLHAEFRGSPWVGPFKVYPKIEEFAHRHRIDLEGSAGIELAQKASYGQWLIDYYIDIPQE